MQQNDGLYHPSTSGTSIKDILNEKITNTIDRVDRVDRVDKVERAEKSIEDLPNLAKKSSNLSMPDKSQLNKQSTHRHHIGSLDTTDEPFTETLHEDNDVYPISSKTNIGFLLIEPLLLLTIYVIMSQPFVFSFIAGYIKQLNTLDDDPPFSGILIYGIILTVTFLLLRKLIYQKMQ